MRPDPTYAIGVGQAGISVMETVRELTVERDVNDRFQFAAIDTDRHMLGETAPETTTIHLTADPRFIQEDVTTYPYLTREVVHNLDREGAMRQRAVGRYKLESTCFYSSKFVDLWNDIKTHCSDCEDALSTTGGTLNMYLIHSFGGGTGSGTFPRLLAMLDEFSENLAERHFHVYLGGVGIVPEINFDPAIRDPPGDSRYYQNAYAALRDLDKLEALAASDESRALLDYGTPTRSTDSQNAFELQEPPFDDYWLFGVDERKIAGDIVGNTGVESYRERVNRTIAHALYAQSTLETSATHWAKANPYIGTFDQTELRVPHETVLEYYDLQKERTETQRRIDEDIAAEIDEYEQRRADLRTLKETLSTDAPVDSDLRETIQERVDETFPTGAEIVAASTAADIDQFIGRIHDDHDLEGTIAATTILRKRLHDDTGLPAVETDYRQTISALWTEYDMSARSQYTTPAVKGKATATLEFLHDRIDEYTDIVENWDPGIISQVQYTLPPVGPFESKQERAERILDRLRDARDDLERIQHKWGRVSDIRSAIDERRHEVRKHVDERMNNCSAEISDRRAKREELQREISRIEDNIEALRANLAQEQTSQRVIVLPIKTENLDSIDPENAANILTSINKYEQKDLIETRLLRTAIGQSVEFCDAGSHTVIERDVNPGEHREPEYAETNEMWLLYHEDNAHFEQDVNTRIWGTRPKTSGEQVLRYLPDPYRMEFVSFCRRGSVPALTVYQQLDEMRESGTLQATTPQHPHTNFSRGFAYPEWYGRDVVGPSFTPDERISLSKPPEMDVDNVDRPDLSEEELKSWVRMNGLDSYIWNGVMMDNYDDSDANTFTGWGQPLSSHAVTWIEIHKSTPAVGLKNRWLQGHADWKDILDAYIDNLFERTGVKIVFEST